LHHDTTSVHRDVVRTTVTLDDDVLAELQQIQVTRGTGFEQTVNDALRAGLPRLVERRRPRGSYQTSVVDLGRCLIDELDDVAEALAVADGEQFR
jgi:Arc/MetJ family transcription regulator